MDILAKIGFELIRVPTRNDRAIRLWEQDQDWLLTHLGEKAAAEQDRFKSKFWLTALDHYRLFGIDDLEQAKLTALPSSLSNSGAFSR